MEEEGFYIEGIPEELLKEFERYKEIYPGMTVQEFIRKRREEV